MRNEFVELRARRLALGLDQIELAEALHVNQSTVSKWETGKSPIPRGVWGEMEVLEEAQEDQLDAFLDAGPRFDLGASSSELVAAALALRWEDVRD